MGSASSSVQERATSQGFALKPIQFLPYVPSDFQAAAPKLELRASDSISELSLCMGSLKGSPGGAGQVAQLVKSLLKSTSSEQLAVQFLA